jgi:hypothetical protein
VTLLSVDFVAEELESSVRLKRPKSRRGIGSRDRVEILRAESEELRKAQRWNEMKPAHLVALWAWLYESVYRVPPEPSEVAPKAFNTAALFAGRALAESFGGSAERMVGFMRWTWAREYGAKKLRPDGRRIGARLQFSTGLIGDWRIATAGRVA